jgi:hypothetical protein
MSKLETPMIEKLWCTIGGTLIEEYPVTIASSTCGVRRVDAIILPNREKDRISCPKLLPGGLTGEDIIVVQAKFSRLGMSLMGQAVFSAELMKQFNPATIRSIALCRADDSVLRPLLASFPLVEVVVLDNQGNLKWLSALDECESYSYS